MIIKTWSEKAVNHRWNWLANEAIELYLKTSKNRTKTAALKCQFWGLQLVVSYVPEKFESQYSVT